MEGAVWYCPRTPLLGQAVRSCQDAIKEPCGLAIVLRLRALSRSMRPLLHFYWRFSRAARRWACARMVIDGAGRVFLVKHSYVAAGICPAAASKPARACWPRWRANFSRRATSSLPATPKLHGVFFNKRVSRRDHVALFIVRDFRQDTPPEPDHEIIAHGFFAPDALPDGHQPRHPRPHRRGVRRRGGERIVVSIRIARELKEFGCLPAVRDRGGRPQVEIRRGAVPARRQDRRPLRGRYRPRAAVAGRPRRPRDRSLCRGTRRDHRRSVAVLAELSLRCHRQHRRGGARLSEGRGARRLRERSANRRRLSPRRLPAR